MIGEIGRIATAEKMSVEQLQQAYRNKSLPGYIVFPLLEEKMNMQQRMQNAQAMQAQKPPPIADQLMQRANQVQGIEQLPTQLAETQMAHGGIVAFEDGGEVERYQTGALIDGWRIPPEVQRENDKQRKEIIAKEYNKAIELGDENRASLLARELKNLGVVTPVRTPSIKTTPIDGAPPAVGVAAPAGIATPIPKMAAPSAGIGALSLPQDTPGAVVDTGAGEADVSIPTSAMTGDDSNPYEQYINRIKAMTRGSREMSQAEKDYANRTAVSDEDKQRAMWMRALQASLGVFGGRSKYAAENIAAGVSPALQGYMQDVKSQKELETKALGEKAAIARGERLADIQDVYKGLDLYGKEKDLKYKLGTLLKPTDYERRFQAYRPQVMKDLGIDDPNDPRVMAATAELVDKSIGYAYGKTEAGQETAGLSRELIARREASEAIAKRLDQKSSHPDSLRYRQLVKEDPAAAEKYRQDLFNAEFGRIYVRGGSRSSPQSAPSQSPPPEAIKALKSGVVTTFKNGERWTLDESGKPKKVSQ